MRKLYEVLEQISTIAPDLAIPLRSTKESSKFAAPEKQYLWWQQAAQVLHAECRPEHPKYSEVKKIFAGK